MRRMIFAVATCGAVALPAGAQQVPARDLLDFPIGAVAEPRALARATGDGVWNPAACLLPLSARLRVGVAALETPAEQALSAQLLGGAMAMPGDLTLSISAVRAAVDDIVRTDTDPQSVGGAVPYSTTLLSIGLARRTRKYLTAGVAARYRTGELDATRRGAFGVDGGIIADSLFGRDGRIGASTFLWRPGASADERTTYSAAADLRALGSDERREVRAGYGFSYTEETGREHYLFGSARAARLEGRAGLARIERFSRPEWRLRLGVGVYYARYVLGIGRDESGAGLPPTYQFTLTATIK
jgi:hypothetical protein